MSKYDALNAELRKRPRGEFTLSFSQIEECWVSSCQRVPGSHNGGQM